MNAVGIDVSKGKSMVAVMRPFGEVVIQPFEVAHTDSELRKLADLLKSLDGETKVIMECTGNYYQPIAHALHDSRLFVSAVHAKLIHDFGNNTIRKVKTDKADAIKIANSVFLLGPISKGMRLGKIYARCLNSTADNTASTAS